VGSFQGSQGHLLDLLDRPGWRNELNGILASVHASIPSDSVYVPKGSDHPEEWSLIKFCNEHCAHVVDAKRFAGWWVRKGRPPQWDLISEQARVRRY
jgi:hypothetical protein